MARLLTLPVAALCALAIGMMSSMVQVQQSPCMLLPDFLRVIPDGTVCGVCAGQMWREIEPAALKSDPS